MMAREDLVSLHDTKSGRQQNDALCFAGPTFGVANHSLPLASSTAPVLLPSRCVPLSFEEAVAAFPGAELNLSRPMAGDTKTREFENVAT